MVRKLPVALLLAAVAWLAWGFAVETRAAVAALAAPPAPEAVWSWRLGDPGPARLAAFFAAVDRAVPAGSVVALATGTGSADQDFFLSLWAAYDLPRQRVILLSRPEAPHVAGFVAAYGTTLNDPRYEPVLAEAGGTLYRVRP